MAYFHLHSNVINKKKKHLIGYRILKNHIYIKKENWINLHVFNENICFILEEV